MTEKSTHKVEVIEVQMKKHDNADSLSVVNAFGYPVVVRTSDWQNGQLGAYIPPDSLVKTSKPEFSFLSAEKQEYRIRAKKLRGIQSFGLLIPAPAGAKVGDNVAEILEIVHYEPELALSTKGDNESAPSFLSNMSKYDVDSLRRYADAFTKGEPVYVTEKIHGANARFSWMNDRIWCGSRSGWKKQDPKSIWWKALENTPDLLEWCKNHSNHVALGEVYGDVQSFRYGCSHGTVRFCGFDIMQPDGTWVNAVESRKMFENVPQVPLISDNFPFDFDVICSFAEGQSLMPDANHIREGCVVKPLIERWDDRIGRVCLKIVGAGYLEKS